MIVSRHDMRDTVHRVLANMLACHLDIENADHRAAVHAFWESPRIAAAPGEGDLERALASIRKSQARMKVARRRRRGMGDGGAGAASQKNRGGQASGDRNVSSQARVTLEFGMPLSEMLVDFYDQLKSRTQGYASLDYNFHNYRSGSLVKLDILLNEEPVDELSLIVHRDKAYAYGRTLAEKLREVIPRQQFAVPIQAAIGNRIIARETLAEVRDKMGIPQAAL